MTTIRKLVTSKIDGDNANNTDTNEIRPFGEIAVYLDTNTNPNTPVLMMFNGLRTHLKSKVLSPGIVFGSNADSGDGQKLDTIKLIPDSTLHSNGSDQYIVVDPTQPDHIHLRAGGTIDNSSADLFLGGEKNHVKVSDSSMHVEIKSTSFSNNESTWRFNAQLVGEGTIPAKITFPDGTEQITAWAGGRVVNAPNLSVGSAGDQAGDIAFTNTHFYYCFQDYVINQFTVAHASSEPANGVDQGYLVESSYQLPQVGWKVYYNNTETTINQVNSQGIPGFYVVFVDTPLVIPGLATFEWGPATVDNIWRRVAWSSDTW